jgi:hypothetical protein
MGVVTEGDRRGRPPQRGAPPRAPDGHPGRRGDG